MLAAQLTRSFVHPNDLRTVHKLIAGVRGFNIGDGDPTAVRVAGDVSRSWKFRSGVHLVRQLHVGPMPALLDTAHIVDDVSGDEAMFIALRANPGPTDVFNPFLCMGASQYHSESGVFAATSSRDGQSRNPDMQLRVCRRVVGETATPMFTRRDVTGPEPMPWTGRRDLFTYDDNTHAWDALWRVQPAVAGSDIAFDTVVNRLLVSTVEVCPR